MQAEIEKFIAKLRQSLAENSFVKLTLGNYKGDDVHLQKISVRTVETRKGVRLAFQSRFDTRDVVKNFDPEAAVERAAEHLQNGFRSAHLFTTTSDFQLTIGKKRARLTASKPTFPNKPSASHDREKKDLVDPTAYYLKGLGITTDDSRIRADQRDKWKQINKFVEVLASLIENSALKDKANLRIVDMGSGKGYLTFALYDYLTKSSPPYEGGVAEALRGRGGSLRTLQIKGIEQRKDLVASCNDIARASGFDGLNFLGGNIADTDLADIDILIALHACDTATDDALFKGIGANAEIIVAAPCCHREIKKQMKPPELLSGILKHPVMLERTAETVTDGIRSMLLESKGYKTKMFEFVATEHTPKNNLLVATRVGSPHVNKGSFDDKIAQIEAIKAEFGIRHQRLAELLENRDKGVKTYDA